MSYLHEAYPDFFPKKNIKLPPKKKFKKDLPPSAEMEIRWSSDFAIKVVKQLKLLNFDGSLALSKVNYHEELNSYFSGLEIRDEKYEYHGKIGQLTTAIVDKSASEDGDFRWVEGTWEQSIIPAVQNIETVAVLNPGVMNKEGFLLVRLTEEIDIMVVFRVYYVPSI